LAPHITQDRELAYRRGAEAWYRYRKATVSNPFSLRHLADVVTDLPGFLSHRSLQDTDFVPVDRVAAVAVWDTVGALGIPVYVARGKRVDAFNFCDTTLSQKVARGFHAVALDERRNDFTPTLWDAAPHVTQVLFPGAHADVGGGYPVSNDECGLSDGVLHWMITQLTSVGVLFSNAPAYQCKPKPAGTAHKPWIHLPWNLPGVSLGARSFPQGMPMDPAIAARMAASTVLAEPGETLGAYQPTNRP
jgi:hypothetical protein